MSDFAYKTGKIAEIENGINTVVKMYQHAADKFPEKGYIFIDSHGNEVRLTYNQLIKKAKKCLSGLQKSGLKQNDKIILAIDHDMNFIICLLACFLGGIIATAVNTPQSWDIKTDGMQKLIKIWQILEKPYIVLEESGVEQCEIFKGKWNDSKEMTYLNAEYLMTESESLCKCYDTSADDIIFLQFSSGSTGMPKGVQLTNRNIMVNTFSVRNHLGFTEKDIAITWLPHTHDMGLIGQRFIPVISGQDIYVMQPYTFVLSPGLFLKKISEHRATWFCSTNFGYDWMTRNVKENDLADLNLSCLRFTLNGAEPISYEVTEKFINKFKKCGYRETMMFPAYGMAEATIGAIMPKVGEKPVIYKVSRKQLVSKNLADVQLVDENDELVTFYSEGGPVPEVEVKIVGENGETAQEHRVGEVYLKGASITCGYYSIDNREYFSDGWIKTGDLGFIAEDKVYICGRKKDIIFNKGQKLYAHDLEEVIYLNNLVRRGNAVVVGSFNYISGEEELIVFVKGTKKVESIMELYYRINKAIIEATGVEVDYVIPILKIPKTTSGKIQRFVLRSRYEEHEFKEYLQKFNAAKNAKKTDNDSRTSECSIEEHIKKSWAEILNLKEKEIGFNDTFVSLGGNSVKAYRLLNKLNEVFDQEINADIIIKCKTINEMSEFYRQKVSQNRTVSVEKEQKKIIPEKEKVAITGMSFSLPHAGTQEKFWENLCTKFHGIQKISNIRKELSEEDDWDDVLGEVRDIDCFDNDFFGIPYEEAVFMDPQHRLIISNTYQALEDAGEVIDSGNSRNIGVYVGINSNTYYPKVVKYIKEKGLDQVHPKALVGNLNNIPAAFIAHQYNFNGPAMAVDTACSSFMTAMYTAYEAISEGKIEGAVVAASNILCDSLTHKLAKNAGILTEKSAVRTFDEEADGTLLGEGVVSVYLEGYQNALKKGKNIYGKIRGMGINNDGYSLSIMAPNPTGQFSVYKQAYEEAGIEPSEITYIETHGTGTAIGDSVEIDSLNKLFHLSLEDRKMKRIPIGSVKPNIGHLLAAAGGASLVKVLLCMKNRKIIPGMNISALNRSLNRDNSCFYVPSEIQDWAGNKNNVRIAGINCFGFGGTNVHMIIEEEPECGKEQTELPQLITVSAKSQESLEQMIKDLEKVIKNEDYRLNDISFTRNRYRPHYSFRASAILTLSETKQEGVLFFERGTGKKLKNRNVDILIGNELCFDFEELLQVDAFADNVEVVIKDLGDKEQLKTKKGYDEKKQNAFIFTVSLLCTLKEILPKVKNITGVGRGKIAADYVLKGEDITKSLEKYFVYDSDKEEIEMKKPEKNTVYLELFGSKENRYSENMSEQYIKHFSRNEQLKGFLELIQNLYLKGAIIRWEILYPDGFGKIVHLPSYSFYENRVWLNKNLSLEKNGNKIF